MMMISHILIVAIVSVVSPEQKAIDRAKAKIAHLKEDILNLRASVSALDAQQENLNRELKDHEREFVKKFGKILVPLLHWPSLASFAKSGSWIEREHLKFILSQTRQRIISEPLLLISDRELRLAQGESLKSELAATLKSLESKESLLDLQLEDLKHLEKQSKKKKAVKIPTLESN